MTLAATLFFSIVLAPLQADASAPQETAWHFMDRATTPEPSPAMPVYAALLYAESVSLAQFDEAWRAHYEGRDADAAREDLERDPYAKFAHRWLEEAAAFADDEGVVRRLSTAQLRARRLAQPKDAIAAASTAGSGGGTPAWSFVGPSETFWRAADGVEKRTAPWQVNIYCIAAAPSSPTTLYCGSETGAFYKSTDLGVHWTPLDSINWGRAILSVAVHPLDPGSVFCATSTDIFRSTNGGADWDIVLTESGLSCNSLKFDPEQPSTVYAGTGAGLYVTRDSGTTWSVALPGVVDDVEVRPGDGSTVYVNTRGGSPERWTFYRSVDSGQTFEVAMDGWGSQLERSGSRLSVTPADPDVVFALLLGTDETTQEDRPVLLRSADRGTNWQTVATGRTDAFPLNNGQGYYDLDLAISAGDADELIAGTQTSYRSVDGGVTWTPLGGYSGPFGIHPDIQAVISVPRAGGTDTWLTTDGGVNYSSDFFTEVANWSPRILGLDGTNFWGYGQGWNEDFGVGGRYHNGNTALAASYPSGEALRMGGAESPTGWALHGRERHVAFDDISNVVLPQDIEEPIEETFSFTKHPNVYYYGDASSSVRVDLESYLTVYTGQGESFWRSRDGGIQWEATHTFAGRPFHFDLSRANPNRIYLTATNGFFVSNDRGETFVERSLPVGLTDWHSQNLRVSASSTDADTAWVLNQRSGATSTAGRIFETTDGGTTWTDLTTPALAGRRWTAMVHQFGTNGGVYIASSRGTAGSHPARVLYRDRSMSDWVDYSAGLPPSASPLKLLPFYRGNKLRWIGNRGVWEIDLFEQDWAPIAQPFADRTVPVCPDDTLELDSYSVARADATYRWTIPGASWTSDPSVREVQAQFPSNGIYSATLEVEQSGQVSTNSISLFVGGDCDPEPLRGRALELSGATGDYATTSEPLGIQTNTFTAMGWVKRDGAQNQWAGLFFHRGSSSAGLNMRTSTNLGIHWLNGEWGWDSGHTLPDGEWTHVAMVIDPTGATVYMNGVPARRDFSAAPYEFTGPLAIGADVGWSGRRFRGQFDEVAVYDRALTRDEVLASMHLTKSSGAEPDLVGYWQFNRDEGPVIDRAGRNHMGLLGDAARVPSTAPVGTGVSASATVTADGSYVMGDTGIVLTFNGGGIGYPTGDLWVTRIDDVPDASPKGAAGTSSPHWVVHHAGPGFPFGELVGVRIQGEFVSDEAARLPSNYRLYRRAENAHGPTWGRPQQAASSASAGPPSTVDFTYGPWRGGQWVLFRDQARDASTPSAAPSSGG